MRDSDIREDVRERLEKLEKLIGEKIPRTKRKIFITSITHSSFAGEYRGYPSNERLEFLGDSVLSLSITHYLFAHYASLKEGELSKIRAYIVSERSLSEKASSLKIGDIMLFGKGEIKTGGKFKKAVLADTLESIIAAMFLSFGFVKAEKFVVGIFSKELEKAMEIESSDYKTRLQEFVQKKLHTVPEYRIAGEEVTGGAHIFVAQVFLGSEKIGQGKGRTKKEAEENAAREALKNEDFVED